MEEMLNAEASETEAIRTKKTNHKSTITKQLQYNKYRTVSEVVASSNKMFN